ncbi:MAG TPA: 50S ribosomal protein L9 [Planctomycetota bacterium]|nr:50S ribosomal protein L9 [Planctomycetota bacterium]
MQLLLRQDVKQLGKRGQVVNVTTGYGRNYLLPRGMAVTVNPANVRQIEQERRRLDAAEQKRRETLSGTAAGLGKVSVTLQARANEEGHLFGSVGSAEIVAALRDEGFSVTSDMIVLEKPVKELGVFEVEVRLDPEISATVKVWVVGE